jgi:hypothetical protein
MRSIMHIFKKKKEEAKRKRVFANNQVSSTIKALLEEDDSNEGLIMEKELIVEAWTKYRPSSKENSLREGASPKRRDIQEIYGESFMLKLMQGIKQKKYRGKDQKISDDDKLKQHLTNLLVGGKQQSA